MISLGGYDRGLAKALAPLFLLLCLSSEATSIKLAWDASSTTNVVAYTVYWGPSSRFYTNSLRFGTNLTCTLSNLAANTPYWFTATTKDSNGVESDYSNEVKYAPPTNVLMVSVQLLTATNVAGPYGLLTNMPGIWITNPMGVAFFRSYVSATVTNVAK